MLHRRNLPAVLLASVGTALAARPAAAIDEIQVYNADIAEIGQWTVEQHLNYVLQGRTQPDVPGGLISNHSLNGTPELAYGVTDWWELGFYAPFAVNSGGTFLSDGGKIRNLFVVPDAAKRTFVYGVNVELGYATPAFSQSRWTLEVRPILGGRNSEWEFIVNPIVDMSFGSSGEADFAPAARLARKLDKDLFAGLEYYSDFGRIGDMLPLRDQQHTLFAVTDFKVGEIDVDLGIGRGLTPGSDHLVVKMILGYAFPAPGQQRGSDSAGPKSPPGARPVARDASVPPFPWNGQ